jgi:hypothetical protein
MGSFRLLALLTLTGLALPVAKALGQSPATYGTAGGSGQSMSRKEATPEGVPNGKKLVLKDGSFHIVRSYQRSADRVRYFSLERGEWEEIPAAMVDWEATQKAEDETAKQSAALVEKLHRQELAGKIAAPLDVDASLQVGNGIFLPPGEGMFAIEGHSVKRLEQAGAEVRNDKKQIFKQIISPVPIVPSKQNVEIPGSKAKLRISSANPEFYLREAPPDPDRVTPIQKSSRPGEEGPEVELLHATVKGHKRRLESMKSLFGIDLGAQQKLVSMQRWDVAPNVFRFTLSEPLPPGEYALAEVLPDGINLYVWDFGVDGPAPAGGKK